MRGKIILNPQEEKGDYKFNGIQTVVTRGFIAAFGDEYFEMVLVSLEMINQEYGNQADYLQTFYYELPSGEIRRYWAINDANMVVTFLLPEEY